MMHVICDRDLLAPATCSISRLAKHEVYPLYSAVLLTASASQVPEQGTLTLAGLGMLGTVGLFTQLSATVKEEGSVLVPVERLAEYIEALRSGSLVLSQEMAAPALVVEPMQHQMVLSLATPERVAPLLIESTHTSHAGTTSTNKARLQAWSALRYPLPPVPDWGRTPLATCTLQASLLKKILAACAQFARSGAWRKGSAAEMYGVLVHLHAHAITLSATTGTMFVSHRLPLEQPTPLTLAGLFEGKALSWMKEALPKSGKVTFTLTRDAQTQKLILLLSTSNVTWFCQCMEVSCPVHWEDILQQPHEAELLIRRGELKDPLNFFAKAADVSEGVAIAAEGKILRMSTVAGPNDILHADQTLQLVNSSTDCTVLVNPKQFQRLVSLVSGDLLRLEIGHFERQEGQAHKRIDFLRIASEQTTVMMSLSRSELASASTPSQKAGATGGDTELALASQEA